MHARDGRWARTAKGARVHLACLVALCAAAVLVLVPAHAIDAAPRKASLTREEAEWVRRHPTVRFASDARLRPLEYVEDGRFKGLTAEYLDLIEARTGLTFEFVPTASWDDAQAAFMQGKVDVLPQVMPERVSPAVRERLVFSMPYLVANSVVFTRPLAPAVLDMRQLAGKTVAARSSGMYAEMIERTYPWIKVMPMPSPDAALGAVVSGEADAAMGTSLTFQPFMKRRFASELNISRPRIDLVMQAQIGSRADQPLLASVINKGLLTVSTAEESALRDRWLKETDYGAPTLGAILKYNRFQVLGALVAISLVLAFAYSAHRAKRRARESERVKMRFLAMMSHEIRTPIGVISGSIEVLLESALDERQRRLAATASHATEGLGSLLDNVLDLSKLDERHMALEHIPTDVGGLLLRVADLFRQKAAGQGLALDAHIEGDGIGLLLVDPTRLRQVVINLLSNAIKFTERGRVTLAASIRAYADTCTLQVRVSDTGIGIPLDQRERLFEPYTQADDSTTRQFGGTGLGLAICRELVDLMGGRIWIDDNAGAGTTFCFEIPSISLAPASAVQNAPAAGASHGKVLLVDDHPDNRFVIGQQLAQIGLDVDLAEGGAQALELMSACGYRLVLMDCHMPGIDGYSTVKQLRVQEDAEGRKRTPVVALSAATDARHLAECFSSGMDGVLRKPVRIDELRAIVDLWGDPTAVGNTGMTHNAAVQTLGPEMLALRYHASIIQDLQTLRVEAVRGNWVACEQLAHRIRGAALIGGYDVVAQWMAAIELAPQMVDIEQCVDDLLKALNREHSAPR